MTNQEWSHLERDSEDSQRHKDMSRARRVQFTILHQGTVGVENQRRCSIFGAAKSRENLFQKICAIPVPLSLPAPGLYS